MWHEIKNIICNKNSFLLTTHVNPDGDGIGSACALVELLLFLGKRVKVVTDNAVSSKFNFLDYHALFQEYSPESACDVEVLICVDTHRIDRIGRLAEVATHSDVVSICIDHHPVTETFSHFAAMDPKACSTGAMIYSLFKEFGFELNYEAATGLYTSVICDTGRFSYSSTNRIAHKIADECIKLGVDPDRMHTRLFQHVTMGEIRMFAKALEKMESYLDNRVVIEQICMEDYEKTGGKNLDLEHIDLDYIHEFNKLIEDVECAVLLREVSNQQVRVSIRCKSDLDIGSLMEKLGGGGHRKAAGVTLKGSLEEVKSRILQLLGEVFAAGQRT